MAINTYLFRWSCAFFITCLLWQTSVAQQSTRKINGTIKDNTGAALPGATILAEATDRRAVSNDDGSFTIEVPNKGKQRLRVTILGYHEKTATLDEGQTHIEIALKENVQEIDPVIIVGYATQKKSSITNAVEQLDFKDLENIPQSNTIDILSGRIAGLSVTSVGGQPGADDSEVKLRGTVTTGIAYTPLIIIDGVQAGLKELSTLAPNEIAEITVLKDASSAAIYGSRGANGVILVTTKAPTPGKSKISLNSSYAWQQGLNLPRFVESWQWMILQNEAGNANPAFTPQEIEQVKAGQYTDELANTNPTANLFRTAPQMITNLSLSGGSKDLSYQASFGYLNQEGIMKNTQAKRYNYRLNITSAITKKLDASINISGYSQNRYEPYTDPKNILRNDVFRSVPITPEKYANGDWGVYNSRLSLATKPPSLVAEIGNNDLLNRRLTVVPQLIYKPIKGLTLKANLSYTNTINGEENFLPTYLYPSNGVVLRNDINSLYKFNSSADQIQLTNLATYNFNINKKHVFTMLAGYEFMDFKRDRFSVTGTNLATNDKQVLDQVTANIVPTGMKQHWAYQSVFGRLNYAFQNKYYFEANLRRDGSSRLPSNMRYSNFPSVSAGWMLSKEKFFAKINPGKVFDQVKFRASWGKTGNDIVGVRNYYQTYEFSGYYTLGEDLYAGAIVHEFSNEGLHWITSTTTNLGLDMGLFKNKLNITLDVYDRMHKGVYFYYDFPPSMGNATQRFSKNAADVQNKGLEIAVKYRNGNSKLNYNVGLTYARNTNEVVGMEIPETIAVPFIMTTGIPFNSIYGYVYDGIMKDAAEAKYTYNGTGTVGSMKFKDLNNNGIIDPGDRTVLGASQIPHEFGLTGGIRYKGFDMSFLLYAVKGKQIYIRDWGNLPGTHIQSNFWSEWWDNRYDATSNPEGTWPVFSRTAMGSDQVSSFWVHNADFMRLKNLEVGYTLQPKTLARLGVSNLRVYFSGQNLFTLTNLIKQVDPERFTRQTNNATYPQVKMFTAGLNLSL